MNKPKKTFNHKSKNGKAGKSIKHMSVKTSKSSVLNINDVEDDDELDEDELNIDLVRNTDMSFKKSFDLYDDDEDDF
ncbi:MAG: hypothetical protein ACK4K9_06945 [Bacteroidia bacterium]